MEKSTTVCHCFSVTVGQIEDAVKGGAGTLEAVQEATHAGTGSGACKPVIQEVIDSVK